MLEKPVRRRFDAEYKARILREADQLTQPGQLGPCFVAKASSRCTCQCGESSVTMRHLPASVPSGVGGSPTRLCRWSPRTSGSTAKSHAFTDGFVGQRRFWTSKKPSEILGIELPPNDYVKEP